MKVKVITATAMCLLGCILEEAGPSMHHEVSVPRQYRTGRLSSSPASDLEDYISGYEDGWWSCIEKHRKNIDYVSMDSDRTVSGNGARISGYWVGFEDAEERIQRNISRFGKQRTLQHLSEIWESQ